MLVLSRKLGEEVHIGESVKVRVVRIKGKAVSLAIDAPASMAIHRHEPQPLGEQLRQAMARTLEGPEIEAVLGELVERTGIDLAKPPEGSQLTWAWAVVGRISIRLREAQKKRQADSAAATSLRPKAPFPGDDGVALPGATPVVAEAGGEHHAKQGHDSTCAAATPAVKGSPS